MGLFGLGRKKYDKMSVEEMLAALQDARKKENEVKIAELFWEIANRYLKEGKDEKALSYLHQFDDLVGGDDDLYTKFQDKDDDAADLIEELSLKPSYIKEVADWVEEKAKDLTDMQKMQWAILSMARMNWLFGKLSQLEGFEVFVDYEEVVQIMAQGIYLGIDVEEEDILDDFVLDAGEIDTSAMLSVESKIEIEGQPDYEALDIIGGRLHLDLMLAMDGIVGHLEEDEESKLSLHIVTGNLHRGYFGRAYDMPLHEIPAVVTEKTRIMADYEYIKGEPGEDDFAIKTDEYLASEWL